MNEEEYKQVVLQNELKKIEALIEETRLLLQEIENTKKSLDAVQSSKSVYLPLGAGVFIKAEAGGDYFLSIGAEVVEKKKKEDVKLFLEKKEREVMEKYKLLTSEASQLMQYLKRGNENV